MHHPTTQQPAKFSAPASSPPQTLLLALTSAVLALTLDAAVVRSEGIVVSLDESKRGVVSSIVDAAGRHFESAVGVTTLFHLKATMTNDFSRSVSLGVGDAGSFECRREGNGICLHYGGFKEAVKSVTCSIRPDGDAIRWGFAAELEPEWALEANSYPRLALTTGIGGNGADDRFVLSTSKGGVYHAPGQHEVGWALHGMYPASLPAQFAALYDATAGVYFAADDGEGHVKRIGVDRTREGLVLAHRAFDFAMGAYRQPYDVVIAALERCGSREVVWQDAADRYREWAFKQKWCCRRLFERTDLPKWMRDASVIVRFSRKWLDNPDDIHRWLDEYWVKEYPKSPLISAFWGWEKHGDFIGPDYFPVHPSEAAFASLVEHLCKIGGHVFTWPSGYRWSIPADAAVPTEHIVINRDGTAYRERPVWLKGAENRCLCGGDEWTRDWWNREVVRPLASRGSELIQIDQQVGGGFPPCWSQAHGHAPGEGLWKTEAIRRQLESMRRVMLEGGRADAVVGVEEPNEHLVDLVGIQDYRDCETRAEEWASVFNYLYHEFLPVFQSNPRRGNRMWQAHAAADGQMPFLKPDERDFTGERDGYDRFMRRWIELYRGEGRKYLAYGRQIRPPKVICAVQPYSMRFFNDPITYTGERPVVFVNAYLAADGSRAVVLANATDCRQSVEIVGSSGDQRCVSVDGDDIVILK